MFIKRLSLAIASAAISLTLGCANALTTVSAEPNNAATRNFDQIYVFGDSLSDVGNVYKATQGQSPSSPPYYKGRYSNGPVWVEYLASNLKLTSTPETNFAFGGATTGESRSLPIGLLAQIKTFTATHQSADPQALYIVWAGANDYLGGVTDTKTPINNLATAVKSLSAAGAKNIVVVNLPDLGQLPSTRNSRVAQTLNAVTRKHNTELARLLNNLHQQLNSDTKLIYLDANSLFNQAIKTPKKFGFKNVTQACFSQGRICNNPKEYLFWDGIHPTTIAHQLLVQSTFSDLKPAPQPSASTPNTKIPLGMMILGILGTGLIIKSTKVI